MSLTTLWQGYTSQTLLQPTATTKYNNTLYWCQLSPDNPKLVQCYSLAPPRLFEFEDLESSITALALSNNSSLPLFLSSATSTRLSIWTVPVTDSCTNQQITAELDCCNGDVVTQLRFNPSSKLLVCCSGAKLFVFKLGKFLELNAIFEGHSLPITCLSFFSINTNLSVTCSQDRTFRIWDISNNIALYESSLLSAAPLISTETHPSQDVVMLGAADGTIWLFEWFNDVRKCFMTFELDMKIHFMFSPSSPRKSLLSPTPPKTQNFNATIQTINSETETEKEEVLASRQSWNLTGAYFYSPVNEFPLSYLSPALSHPTYLLLTTKSSLLIINSNTGTIEYTTNLLEDLGSIGSHAKSITHTQFTESPVSSQEFYFLAILSPHDITLFLKFKIPDLSKEWELDKPLNFQASSPLHKSSPLSTQLSAKPTSKETLSFSKPSSSSGNRCKKQPQSLDQPIVFHTKIKSSGYGQTPKSKMFAPQNCKSLSARRPISKSQPCLRKKEYAISDRFPSREKGKIQMIKQNGGVRSLSCSSDGEILGCGLIDGTIALLSDPSSCKHLLYTADDKPRVLNGHTGRVECLGWSHSGKHLVSASNAECLLWDVRGLRSLLSIGNSTSQPIGHIQFFYVDKFILLTHGSELCLYAYALENSAKQYDDIKRYLNLNTWKIALRVNQPVHSITACSAANAFFSHIALLGLSNRTLAIHDLNADKQVGLIQLDRVANIIHQYEGSKYCGVQTDAFNMFLTSAVQEGIRVWDLRAKQCVVKYSLHKNNAMPLDCKVSPCGRLIATGSEDKCVYVYDLRGSTRVYVEKIMGFSDVTTHLLFRPSCPELIVSTLDSYLHAFK